MHSVVYSSSAELSNKQYDDIGYSVYVPAWSRCTRTETYRTIHNCRNNRFAVDMCIIRQSDLSDLYLNSLL